MLSPIHLFEAFGVELEYMIVERGSLRAQPLVAPILRLDGPEPAGFEPLAQTVNALHAPTRGSLVEAYCLLDLALPCETPRHELRPMTGSALTPKRIV